MINFCGLMSVSTTTLKYIVCRGYVCMLCVELLNSSIYFGNIIFLIQNQLS